MSKGNFIYLAPGSHVIGDVTCGEDCSVWYNAVIRADVAPITMGDRCNVQDNCVLHVTDNIPLTLGNDVTVGHSAIIHSATVGDNTIVGMGSILLDGCKIGNNTMVGAGTLVSPNKIFPDGVLLLGRPAKVVRQLSEDEIRGLKENADEYVRLARKKKS